MNNGGAGAHLLGAPPPGPAAAGGNGHDAHPAVLDTRLKAVEANLEKVDTRLAAVEGRLVAVETRIEYLATKEDIKAMQAGMLKWGIGVFIALFTGILATLGSVLFLLFRQVSG